jgi:arylsulfatase A-like enzyme
MGITKPYHPNTRGFDQYYGFLGGGHQYFPAQFKPAYERQVARGIEHINEYLLPLERNGEPVDETEYVTDGLSREAVNFVHQAEGEAKPFFLYLAYNAPHSPLQAKQEDLKHYAHIEDKNRRIYAAMVHAVDRGVGELVAALKQTGAFENTLIVFLSDNGGKLSLGANNGPLREGKGSAYEGGYRTPMLFHWPEGLPAGRSYNHPVTSLDFYPTFAELANARVPATKKLDGRNIMPAVVANRDARPGEMIYVLRHRKAYHDVGGRIDNWKVSRVGQSPWKLFNLAEDMSEERDLSAKYPLLVDEMVGDIELWTHTHAEPQWFHIWKEGEEWRADGMPRYDETFGEP